LGEDSIGSAAVVDGDTHGVQVVWSAVDDANDTLGVALVCYGGGIGNKDAGNREVSLER
jgi:hypothetical protein